MKKLLGLGLILGLGMLMVAGCQTSSQPAAAPKLVDNATAASYSDMGVTLTQDVNNSIVGWANGGSVTGGILGSSIRGASLNAQTVTGPDADGYYHVTEEVSSLYGTYEADLYVKLTKNISNQVTDVYVYGSHSFELVSPTSGTTITYSMTFGSGKSTPYHATATWSGTTLSSVTATGPLALTIASATATASHQIVMTYAISNLSIPVTSGDDYPTGSITITVTYDGQNSAGITITFNGTSTATLVYDGYTTTFTIPAT